MTSLPVAGSPAEPENQPLIPMPPHVHDFAQSDTPQQIEVPPTWAGLITWAIGRFGIGIVFAYGLWIVYGDLKSTNEKMMGILQQRAVTDSELARSMSGLTQAITAISEESRRSHAFKTP